MKSTFVLQHLNLLPTGEVELKLVGVYSSRNSAEDAVSRLSTQPGFSENPQIFDYESSETEEGFHIDEYEIDEDKWTEGFVTV